MPSSSLCVSDTEEEMLFAPDRRLLAKAFPEPDLKYPLKAAGCGFVRYRHPSATRGRRQRRKPAERAWQISLRPSV
jgi:hypothetical protein